MKILRPATAAAVLSASFAFSAASEAADADAINVSPQTAPITQAVDSTHSVARTYEQIRADVSTAEFTGDEMLGRIDSLVSRIDSLMKSVTENNNELMQLRNASLQMRGEVVEFLGGNGSQLVQFQTALPPVESIIAGTDGQFGGEVVGTDGSVPVSTPGGFASTGPVASGGGGGFAGGGGGGGGGFAGGGLGALGAAAAAAVAIADDDDDDDTFSIGPIASQSSL